MSKSEDLLYIGRILFLNDKNAYRFLVNKYQSSLRRYLLYLTRNDQALSDDIAQEAFIKAYINLQSFKGIAGFQTWLFRIAYNLYFDHCRSSKPRENDDVLALSANQSETNLRTELSMDLNVALKQLKEEERSILSLFYFDDMSVHDIAKVMDLPTGTIKSHLSRGRKKLSIILSDYKK
ncbi:MAG: sigma-70 family RNA polymerase sigma factor [Bacteroidales bacterium]|nr:sigma-70 family RNA polymerase sigma factor [Bacteroidales bacterium]